MGSFIRSEWYVITPDGSEKQQLAGMPTELQKGHSVYYHERLWLSKETQIRSFQIALEGAEGVVHIYQEPMHVVCDIIVTGTDVRTINRVLSIARTKIGYVTFGV